MDILDIRTTFFRRIAVHLENGGAKTTFFRPIPVHFAVVFHYLCTGMHTSITSTTMAGTVKEMSLIKQVIQLKQLGESNRGIARKLPINKETGKLNLAQQEFIKRDYLTIGELDKGNRHPSA